jgi:hypothetical protein
MRITRIPVPLLLAAAVAVGITVTLIIQVVIIETPPAIVFPTILPPEETTTSYTLTIYATYGEQVHFATVAGMGRFKLWTNTTGWNYTTTLYMGTVVLKSPGDYDFTLSSGESVFVRDLNSTHALVAVDNPSDGVIYGFVTKKVRVGPWYVYHPVVSKLDTAVVDVIRQILNNVQNRGYFCLFQPTQDYIEIDTANDVIIIKCDMVDLTDIEYGAEGLWFGEFFDVPADPRNPLIFGLTERLGDAGYYHYSAIVYLKNQFSSTTVTALSVQPFG